VCFQLVDSAANLMVKVSEGNISLDDALASDIISQLQTMKDNWRESMKSHRTARLWIMYMDMIQILRTFITASRSGNWKLYLQALHQMLPFLAAPGHHNYVKSLVLYLDKMEQLEHTHPSVYSRFLEGLFVLRRSDSYWSGIYSDLYIEQVLMGSIKSVGGLTRGRGFDESTSLVWLMSMPACGEVHKAVLEIASLSNSYSVDMHKDRINSRMDRDSKDLQSVLDYLTERTPFGTDCIELRSLSSGIVAEKSVNVDSADIVGSKILTSMDGMYVSKFKFSKKEQVFTLASSMYVSLDGEKIEMDAHQLYQRLLVAGIGTIDLPTLFQYEICSYPASLFDQKLLMRQADKADLRNV